MTQSTSKTVYIVSAARTPVGTFQGALAGIPAPKLGSIAIKSALVKANLQPTHIDECIMGEVLTAGVGQAPARQAALYAGLPNSVPCMTINKVCGSGLKSMMLGSDSILLGHADTVVTGGQENMSLAPHLLENSRTGYRLGPVTASDSLVKDGLWDPYNNFHMGSAAEICAREYKISRKDQDDFAIESYKRAQSAQKNGSFKNEIAAVEITTGKETISFTEDEEPGKAKFDKIPGLRAAFEKDGTITAANASKINDGGAAIILASDKKVKELNLKPLAKIVSYATFAQDPKWFTTAPVGAIKKALEIAKIKVSDIDLFEINEAFSVVTMAAMRDLNIPHDKVNVNGGAVAIGHPIGASGARIMTTLLHTLKQNNKRYGLATLCIGGGEAVAVVVENIQ
ncbi:MAG: thiolase family protein [Bdellovibrionales bacterium]